MHDTCPSKIVDSQPIMILNPAARLPSAQRVVVVMATYNGARFIEAQIRSIQAQSYAHWVLYIRDDGSRDETVQKILHLAAHDQRIQLVQNGLGNQGVVGNFSMLLEFAAQREADYVFLADQDDVWYPDKLAIMLANMQDLEQNYLATTPLLVHCDLAIVDSALQPVANSFVIYSGLYPATAHLGVLLSQNQITGCASLINRALLKLACPLPKSLRMHDWWLALLAAAAGKIAYIPQPLVQYRQHAGSVVGAVSLMRRFVNFIKDWHHYLEVVRRSLLQAEMLEARLLTRGIQLPDLVKRQLHTFTHILNRSPLNRARQLRKQQIGMHLAIPRWVFIVLITIIKKT